MDHLWSFKKNKRKNKIDCISHYSWKSQFGNDTWQSSFTFPPSTDILWNLLPYPSTDFPLYSQQKKRNLKHYERGVSHHLFPTYLDAVPVTQPGPPKFITEDQNTKLSHVFMTFLIVLTTSSLHIEMVIYCTSYSNNRTCQFAYKYTATKLINFHTKWTRVRWSVELFWLKIVVPTSKMFEKRCCSETLNILMAGFTIVNE